MIFQIDTLRKTKHKIRQTTGVNLNLYKTLKEVLFNLLQQVKSDQKTWVRIGFHGVPC